ncbi:MAG: hypothetical protein V1754_06165, partial [Pseudomonadota bacterium]
RLYDQPQVRPVVAEGRSFVRRSQDKFDVIQATFVDTWAATAAGAFALAENYIYTVEAFEDYLSHLTPTGIITMTRWVHVPGMEFVRLAAVARRALERMGVKEPYQHTFAAYSGALGTLLVKRSPFTKDELLMLQRECDERGYSVFYSPDQRRNNPVQHVLGPEDPALFFQKFPVDVRPVFDERPFFFYSVKPERVFHELMKGSKGGALNSFSLQILAGLTVMVAILLFASIMVPLWWKKRHQLVGETGSKIRDLLFFVCLGVGFIVVELGLLQRFSLHLGHPTYSLQVVLFSVLFFSGVGSLVSGKTKTERGLTLQLGSSAAGTAVLITIYIIALRPLLYIAIAWSLVWRILLCMGLVAMPAFLMGMLVPTGVRLVSLRHKEIIPWCWGLNGAASVFGAVLTMVFALHFGISATLGVGALAYIFALFMGLRRLGGCCREVSDLN